MDGFNDVFDKATALVHGRGEADVRQAEAEQMLALANDRDSYWDNRGARETALHHAIDYARVTSLCDKDEVISAARAFYAFLTEE